MTRAVSSLRSLVAFTSIMLVTAGAAWSAAPRASAPERAVAKAPTASTGRTVKSAAKVVAKSTRAKKSVRPGSTAQAATTQAGTAGMRIFRDPQTGEIGPPTAEHAAEIARDSHPVDVANLPQIKLPGGGYEVLTEGIEDAVILQIDAKGNRVVRCVTDPKAAHKHVPAQAPAAPREDR